MIKGFRVWWQKPTHISPLNLMQEATIIFLLRDESLFAFAWNV